MAQVGAMLHPGYAPNAWIGLRGIVAGVAIIVATAIARLTP
jgi:hypothetical protein